MSLVCQDLATKAELQELRNQLKTLLGEQVGGGEIDVLEQGDFTGTVIGEKLDLAESAIQDIELHDSGGSQVAIVDDIALLGLVEGTHKFIKTQGSNLTKPLSFLTETTKKTAKTLIQNRSVGKVTTGAGKVAGKSVAILTSLLSIVTSLGLNIATVKTLGFRIDQLEKAVISWNTDHGSLIRLHNLSNNNLDKANQEILKNKTALKQQQQQITSLEDDLANSENLIAELTNLIDQVSGQIVELQEENNNLQQKITDFEGEVTEEIQELQTIVTGVNTQLEEANTKIEDLTKANEKLSQDLEELKKRNKKLNERLKETTTIANNNAQEISTLKQEIAQNKDLTNTKLKTIEAKLILAEDALKKGNIGGGGFPIAAKTELANTQEKTLELTNLLAGNPFSSNQLQIDPNQLGINNPFTQIFNQLVPQIDFTNTELTPMQLNEITNTITETIETKFDDIGLGNVPGDVTTIKNNTTPEKIKQNVDESICEQTKPGKCLNEKVKKPLEQEIKNVTNNLNITLLGLPDLFPDSCDEVLDIVKDLRDKINQEGENARLEKRILAAIYANSLHNAAMISTEIEKSVPLATSAIWDDLELKDYLGENIDSQSWTNARLQEVGATENKESKQLSGANRLYYISPVIPETWSTKINNDRPQLVVIYKPKNPNYEPETSRWRLTIPHINPAIANDKIIDLIPSFYKGSIQGLLTLPDNSRVVIYANSEAEVNKFFTKIITNKLINPEYTKEQLPLKIGNINNNYKEVEVVPELAKFFSSGQKNLIPDWVVFSNK